MRDEGGGGYAEGEGCRGRLGSAVGVVDSFFVAREPVPLKHSSSFLQYTAHIILLPFGGYFLSETSKVLFAYVSNLLTHSICLVSNGDRPASVFKYTCAMLVFFRGYKCQHFPSH